MRTLFCINALMRALPQLDDERQLTHAHNFMNTLLIIPAIFQ